MNAAPQSAPVAAPRPTRVPRRARAAKPRRMADEELARLRRKVDCGQPLELAVEADALIAEMMRATAAIKPAAQTLTAALQMAQASAGRELGFEQIEALWESDAGLRAVKNLYDRERARWRRANGILRESNHLLRGEAFPIERRAPFPVGPAVPRSADRRRRRRPWQR